MNNNDKFVSIISRRSKENLEAFEMLFDKGIYSICMSIIRMELDSYIRLYYYDRQNMDRESILESFFEGRRLKDRHGKVLTDKKLVEFGEANIGQDAIYALGCNFIHLSKFHDEYDKVWEEPSFKEHIINVINQHYIAQLDQDTNLSEVLQYLPKVMYKIHYHIHRIIGILIKG